MDEKEYNALQRRCKLLEEERALEAVFKKYGNDYLFIDFSTKQKGEPPDFSFNDGKYGFEMTIPINEDIEKQNKDFRTISIAISKEVSKAIGNNIRFSFLGNPLIDFSAFGKEERKSVMRQLIDYSLKNNLNKLNGTIFINDFKNWNLLNYFFCSITASSVFAGFTPYQISVNSLDKNSVLKQLEKKQEKTNYPNIPLTLVLHMDAYFQHPICDYKKDIEMLKGIDYAVYTRFEHIFFVYFENKKEFVEKLK